MYRVSGVGYREKQASGPRQQVPGARSKGKTEGETGGNGDGEKRGKDKGKRSKEQGKDRKPLEDPLCQLLP